MTSSSSIKVIICCVLVCNLECAAATNGRATPLSKVIELIDVLSKQIEKDGKEDAKIYQEYTKFYQKTKSKSDAIIKESSNNIAQLKSDLKEADAFREGKNKELIDLANKIAKNEGELSAAQAGRKKERKLFETNEATFVTSIDQLERSLVVMRKKAPAKEVASSSASLLSIAEKLRNTLTSKSSDFSLSASQHSILDGFVRAAQLQSQDARSGQAPPSFLQSTARARGASGDVDSGSGGLIGMLVELKAKVKKERDAALVAETAAQEIYKEFESGLTTAIENGKKSKADLKRTIAMSQEQSSAKQAEKVASEEIYKTEIEHLEQVETEFRQKTQSYKIRLGERSDEAVAVHEAQRILSSEEAKSYSKLQSIGTPASSEATFLQLSKRKSQLWRQTLLSGHEVDTYPLTFLAMRSSARIREGSRHGFRADPFAKVKNMIKGMLNKLNAKQAQEAKHHAWCELEMKKTATDQTRKARDVQKMKDRLDALVAELEQTKTDITTIGGDLKDLTETMEEAAVIRKMEHAKAVKAMKEYNGAVKLVKRASDVLKAYYEQKDGEERGDKKKAAKDRDGLATGVIGILEISIDDFRKLYSETKESEEVAATDYEKQQEEGGVRNAVFQKNLEWKSRTKVKLEFDQSTMNNDLKSINKELEALNTYMDKLKASCIAKPDTYAERKAKQQEELKSLREALGILKEA